MKKYFYLIIFTFICTNKSFGQTQAEMNKVAFQSYQKADLELNKVYKQLLSILDNSEKKLLIQAEKDWVKFRDSHCKFEVFQNEGGSIQPLLYSNCLEELTKNRIEELKSSIKERDL